MNGSTRRHHSDFGSWIPAAAKRRFALAGPPEPFSESCSDGPSDRPARRWDKRRGTLRRGAVLCLSAVLLALAAQADQSIRLPEIGDPADTVLSRSEERQLSTIIVAQIRNALPVLNDPELNSYIQSLGARLVSAGATSSLDYTFLLVSEDSVNAFATPGGVIAVFTGLITTAKVESELAGVMAHEIAHVEQRHMARAQAYANQVNVATALGVLAGIAAGIFNPQAGAAVMQSSMAAGTQAQLAFSRSNEQEADRVGFDLLTQARFDPDGMPRFFERLHQSTQLSMGPIPEFLMTHPVTLSRISDTRGRAEQYKAAHPGPFVDDSAQFQLVKARVLALTANPAALIDFYEKSTHAGKKPTMAETFAYGIALTRAGRTGESIEVLSGLQATGDEKIFVQLAVAQAQLQADAPQKALPVLERLNDIYPGTEAIVYYLAQGLLMQGRSREALSVLGTVTSRPRHNPILDELRAKAANQSDQPWLSREAMADYYAAYGQYELAMLQLEMALRDGSVDPISRARIRAKHKEIKDITAET